MSVEFLRGDDSPEARIECIRTWWHEFLTWKPSPTDQGDAKRIGQWRQHRAGLAIHALLDGEDADAMWHPPFLMPWKPIPVDASGEGEGKP